MKKRIFISLIVSMLCMILISCQKKEIELPQLQRIKKIINGGELYLIVETDKRIYEYGDYIHVTATLINKSDEVIKFSMPTSTKNIHQELPTIIENNGKKLINVDMHMIEVNEDSGFFYLNPDEKYIQIMRFSTGQFNEYSANKTFIQDKLPIGIYNGTVTVTIMLEDKLESHTVEFQIEIKDTKLLRNTSGYYNN